MTLLEKFSWTGWINRNRADRHGNRNSRVVDIYRSPGTYRGMSGHRDLQVIGKMPVPKSSESLREKLKQFPNTSRNQAPMSVNPVTNITINGVQPGKEHLVGSQVAQAMKDPTDRLLAQLKEARRRESRLGYV